MISFCSVLSNHVSRNLAHLEDHKMRIKAWWPDWQVGDWGKSCTSSRTGTEGDYCWAGPYSSVTYCPPWFCKIKATANVPLPLTSHSLLPVTERLDQIKEQFETGRKFYWLEMEKLERSWRRKSGPRAHLV